MAQLSGVGVTWYTWLEQGRPINASTQVLDAVARTLKLDQPEREHLYRLADVPDLAPAAEAGWQVSPEIQQILDGLTTLPASVMNERFDLLAWNEPYAALFPGLVSEPCPNRNSLWLCFTHPACCHPYLNRAEQLGTLVAQLRGAYGRHVGEPAWTGFVRRLQAASPEFGQFWAQHEVASPASYLKIFRHPAHDRLVMTTNSLAVLAAPGTRMVVYTPVDEPTRAAVASLIAGEGPTPGTRAGPSTTRSAGRPRPRSSAAPAREAPTPGPGLTCRAWPSKLSCRPGTPASPIRPATPASPIRTPPRAR